MRFIFSLILVAICNLAQTQGQVTFEAYSDAKEVVEGNTFQISFTLKNANGSKFVPPNFNGFKVVSGPNRSISNSIINGNVSSEMTISFMLLAEKKGFFTIRSAEITANRQKLSSKPIKVKVVKAKKVAPGSAGSADYFVVAEFSDSVAYVGQQVLLDYKIYTKKNIDSYSLVSESDYNGIFSAEIKKFNNRPTRIALNGEQYVVQTLRRIALFPQQTGEYLISPLSLRIGIDKEGTGRRSFFFRKLKYDNISSEAVIFKVIPLPENAPSDFCGAVGSYKMNASVTPTNLTTDDAITIKMLIRGNGDGRQLIAKNFEWPEEFDVYDPKISGEDASESGGEMQHAKEIEFVALPTKQGSYQIRPTISYFDIDSARYVQLAVNPVQTVVRRGVNKPGRTNVSPRNITQDTGISDIKSTTQLKRFSSPFFGSLPFWILFFLPFLIYGFLFLKKKKEAEKGNIDPLLEKRLKAQKVAQEKLETAKKYLDKKDSSNFYDEIANATLGYVGDKFNIPLSKMSKSNVEEKLNNLKVQPILIQRFMKILKTTEMARFAGIGNETSMQKIYSETAEVLIGIESELQ